MLWGELPHSAATSADGDQVEKVSSQAATRHRSSAAVLTNFSLHCRAHPVPAHWLPRNDGHRFANMDPLVALRHKCVRCPGSSVDPCVNCSEGVPLVDGATNTYYCGPGRKAKDWENHKYECERLKAHQSLYQAADLFRRLWRILRAQTFPADIDDVAIHEGRVSVLAAAPGTPSSHPQPFARSLFADEAVKDEILELNLREDTITTMRNAIRESLKGESPLLTNIMTLRR